MNTLKERLDRLVVFFAAYTLLFILFFKTLSYTLPFVLALIFASILNRPARHLIDKFKLKRTIASLITTTVFFAALFLILAWFAVMLGQEIATFAKNAQNYVNMYKDNISATIYNLSAFYKNIDPTILSTLENNFSSFITNLSNTSVSLTTKFLGFLLNLAVFIPYAAMVVIFTILATYFFTRDFSFARQKFSEFIPRNQEEKIFLVLRESRKMLFNYVKSYGTIISITFLETFLVFLFFKIKYALILSFLSGLFDLLPILGMGAIYVPTALIYIFFFKNYFVGIGILIAYVVILIIRQIIEPKIVSSSLGIHPIAILAAIFIGLKANGFMGMIFCIFLVVLYTVFKKVEIL